MLIFLTSYLVLLAALFIFQRSLQYHPSDEIRKLADYSLNNFEEKILPTPDNKEIFAWYKPATKKRKLVIYFHGNAGNLGDRARKFAVLAQEGYGVLAISYRGYSRSLGKPTELGLMNDGEAAINFALAQNYKLNDLIFFGESLGSGVAVQMAARHTPYAVVLESPFSSIVSVAQKIYWYVPVSLLLTDKFESIKFAPKITAPVLIIHGTADKVVSYAEGEKLYQAIITAPKKLITVKDAGHLEFSEEFIVAEMAKFLQN